MIIFEIQGYDVVCGTWPLVLLNHSALNPYAKVFQLDFFSSNTGSKNYNLVLIRTSNSSRLILVYRLPKSILTNQQQNLILS